MAMISPDHGLAQELWATPLHEARILASMVDEPSAVTETQMKGGFANLFHGMSATMCGNLFDKTPYAYEKAVAGSGREDEFVKRAGSALMPYLAFHDKEAEDGAFRAFLPCIEREATDGRNYVKKAVNCALRQIGKRNRLLNKEAIATAERVRSQGSPPARWIESDALRELESEAVQARLG